MFIPRFSQTSVLVIDLCLVGWAGKRSKGEKSRRGDNLNCVGATTGGEEGSQPRPQIRGQAGEDRGQAGRGREGWLGPRVIVSDDGGLPDSPCQLTTISINLKRIHLVGRRRSPHVNRALSFGTEDWLLSFPSCSTCLRVTDSSFHRQHGWTYTILKTTMAGQYSRPQGGFIPHMNRYILFHA